MDALRGILRGAMLSAPWTARSPAPENGPTHEALAARCAGHKRVDAVGVCSHESGPGRMSGLLPTSWN